MASCVGAPRRQLFVVVAGDGDCLDSLLFEELPRLLQAVQRMFQSLRQVHECTDIGDRHPYLEGHPAALQPLHELHELPSDHGGTEQPFAVEDEIAIDTADKKLFLPRHLKIIVKILEKDLGIGQHLGVV